MIDEGGIGVGGTGAVGGRGGGGGGGSGGGGDRGEELCKRSARTSPKVTIRRVSTVE